MARRRSINEDQPYIDMMKKQYEAFAIALKKLKAPSPESILDKLNSIIIKDLDANWDPTGDINFGATIDDRATFINAVLKEIAKNGKGLVRKRKPKRRTKRK